VRVFQGPLDRSLDSKIKTRFYAGRALQLETGSTNVDHETQLRHEQLGMEISFEEQVTMNDTSGTTRLRKLVGKEDLKEACHETRICQCDAYAHLANLLKELLRSLAKIQVESTIDVICNAILFVRISSQACCRTSIVYSAPPHQGEPPYLLQAKKQRPQRVRNQNLLLKIEIYSSLIGLGNVTRAGESRGSRFCHSTGHPTCLATKEATP
jgi:hypothetical protein